MPLTQRVFPVPFKRCHLADTEVDLVPVPGGREQGRGVGGLDLELGKDRVFTRECDSSVWVEARVRLEIPRPSRMGCMLPRAS